MVLFPAIGLLIWIAFLFAAMVFCGIIWAVCNVALWLMDVVPRLSKPNARLNPPPAGHQKPERPGAPSAGSVVRVPGLAAATAHATSDIWPKWTASYRRYVDEEKSRWQEQFDVLNSRR